MLMFEKGHSKTKHNHYQADLWFYVTHHMQSYKIRIRNLQKPFSGYDKLLLLKSVRVITWMSADCSEIWTIQIQCNYLLSIVTPNPGLAQSFVNFLQSLMTFLIPVKSFFIFTTSGNILTPCRASLQGHLSKARILIIKKYSLVPNLKSLMVFETRQVSVEELFTLNTTDVWTCGLTYSSGHPQQRQMTNELYMYSTKQQ